MPILLGYWLDEYFDISPWLTLTGCIVGMINVMIVIFRLAKRLENGK